MRTWSRRCGCPPSHPHVQGWLAYQRSWLPPRRHVSREQGSAKASGIPPIHMWQPGAQHTAPDVRIQLLQKGKGMRAKIPNEPLGQPQGGKR
jgi:hypothetical protein